MITYKETSEELGFIIQENGRQIVVTFLPSLLDGFDRKTATIVGKALMTAQDYLLNHGTEKAEKE